MTEPQPTLRPTQAGTLVAGGLVAAAVAWLLISNFYRHMPPLGWPPVIVIGGLAVLEAAVARNIWNRVHQQGPAPARRQPGTSEPVEPLAVARLAVLAKASSLGGALFGGFFVGLLPWLVVEAARLDDASADLPPAIGGLVASAGLVAAALWLERACRVPDEPEGEEQQGTGDPS